jgi:hypothetical protein
MKFTRTRAVSLSRWSGLGAGHITQLRSTTPRRCSTAKKHCRSLARSRSCTGPTRTSRSSSINTGSQGAAPGLWVIELTSPGNLVRSGWTRSVVQTR